MPVREMMNGTSRRMFEPQSPREKRYNAYFTQMENGGNQMKLNV